MKKVVLFTLMVVFLATTAFAADILLTAYWTPNTDSATGYKLYRTDGARTEVAAIPGRATSTYNFSITVPDGSAGTLRFVMTATNATKESPDSVVATFPFDLTPTPVAPGGFGVRAR